jgi:hypothetical protein
MKPWIVLSLLLVPFFASAADFWDGNAALQRGDATFESGLYATSNSFPPGTQITILNQDTGKTVTATVTGRIEGQSDILVLLSPKTAQALGLSLGTLGRVRVTLPARSGATASARSSDQTVSSDPDINPAAGTGQEQATVPSTEGSTQVAQAPATEQPAEQPTTEQQTAEQPTEQPAAEQQTAEQPAEQPATEQQTAEQPAASAADAAAILSDAQGRSPQKQVFQPPREDQKFAYHPPATTQPQTTTPQAAAAAAPAITSVEGEPGVTPPAPASQNMALADVTAPEESRPQEVVSEGTAAPAPASGAPAVALAAPEVAPEQPAAVAAEPVQTEVTAPAAVPPAAGPQPRVALAPPETPAPARTAPASSGTAATTSTATTASSASAASTVQTVQPAAVAAAAAKPGVKGAFYLQLAAFGTEQTARDLAAKLAPTYPALVLTPGGAGSSVYKVVIGPLNRAESGTLLLWFRYRGYPDAFLRQE